MPVFTPDVMALGHFRLIGGSKVAVGVSMKANGCLSLCCLCDGWQMAAYLHPEEHDIKCHCPYRSEIDSY